MAKLLFVARVSCDSPASGWLQPSEVLERAVAKIILVGAKVGVSVDQMIELLDAGMTVEELLEYVLSLARNLPEADEKSSAKSGLQGKLWAQDKTGGCNVWENN